MKTLFNYSNYGNDLRLTSKDAKLCSHSGQCDNDVNFVMTKPYIKKQLDLINPDQLRKELNEYGAWNEDELSNHANNLQRWVWISAGYIVERLVN